MDVPDVVARQAWMAVLARASGAELARLSEGLLPDYELLRGPELGLVMVQGRAGGSGAAFNLSEATVARCTVRTGGGGLGHCYRLGQDLQAAELGAALDAAMQDGALREGVERAVVQPLAAAQQAVRDTEARRAAATQVQFFTMAVMRS